MKHYYYIIIISFIFSSCGKNENPLIGTWIEKDNLNSPLIFKVDEDFYKYYHSGDTSKDIYKIKGDSFLFSNYHQLDILKFQIDQDELKFKIPHNDSIVSTYIRNDSYMEHINSSLNLEINLPETNNEYLTWGFEDISIYLDSNLTNSNKIYIGQKEHDLDSNLFIELIKLKSEYRDFYQTIIIFTDSSIVYSEYKELTTELRKANLLKIANVSISNSGKLNGLYSFLPPYEGILPDSIVGIRPPILAPPEISKNDFTGNNFLIGVFENHLELNNKKENEETLLKNLKSSIEKNRDLMVLIYFDNNIPFSKYLLLKTSIRSVYYDLRNNFSIETYGNSDYDNMNIEDYREVRKRFPIRIMEIESNKYEKYSNYAL